MSTLAMHHRAQLRPRHQVYRRALATHRSRIMGALLTAAEIAETMRPVRICARYLCEGVATEDQFLVFRTAMRIARSIESSRTLRAGLEGHILTVLVACSAINDRAMASGTWIPVELTFAEHEAIGVMVDLHELQLGKVTASQLQAVAKGLIAETLADGGELVRINLDALETFGDT